MKLSNKQALMLFQIAKESIQIAGSFAGLTASTRLQLVNDIINQQSTDLIELKSLENEN